MKKHLALAVVALAVVAGCSTENVPHEKKQTETKVQFNEISGQFPSRDKEVPAGSENAPVGACASLSGKTSAATFKLTDCDNPDSNYRIIQRVATPNDCVKDADRRYYNLGDDGTEWTACMDLAWRADSCLSVQKVAVRRVSCNDTTAENRQKPVRVISNVETVNDCQSGVGFAHPVRRFTICTETQK
ncbi:LppU/SCO3897 family protein [Mycobacteroides salmoniphilum]|uniref:LppU/SCO3897 family protein n=1 Tax=Mycobacteroides salmoniphilum TaxID=404941 RepID=UPI003B8A5B5B